MTSLEGRRLSRPRCCATCSRHLVCPAATRGDLLVSRRLLQRKSTMQALPPLITATAGRPTRLDVGANEPCGARLSLEAGEHARHPTLARARTPARAGGQCVWLSSAADRRSRVRPGGGTEAVPHDRRCRAGCAPVGHRGAGLFVASSWRWWHRRCRGNRRTRRGGGRARRGCAGVEPDARVVRRRPVALRSLFAVDAPVPQSAACVAGVGVRRGACGRHACVPKGWARHSSGWRPAADRLARRGACQASTAAGTVRTVHRRRRAAASGFCQLPRRWRRAAGAARRVRDAARGQERGRRGRLAQLADGSARSEQCRRRGVRGVARAGGAIPLLPAMAGRSLVRHRAAPCARRGDAYRPDR